ncbi:glycosyl transferase family protein [Psychromonas sp. psych-6C06]|uniref:glycosyl transferase family protein n=1 Tax=Psychromonas sp. psych-6C06 TaxID=2058089 RepID=UPI000C34F4DD|nr:glycosyl transferase family protein [Psychromonas sp. psych-6C06]PKF61096.1 glycosyl transferase family protein [Psychromonas sp. psych-6C06]
MFSEYIKLTGRGEKGRRSLTQSEAFDALSSYLDGDAELLQLAVLLMLQRVRCETPEEAAGYIQALRDRIDSKWKTVNADVDWPCFAGKKRQPPFLMLAAKVLAQQGKRVVLHGYNAVDAIKYQVESACPLLDINIATTPEQAKKALDETNICYLPLESYCGELVPLLNLRAQVGLRTPLNTVARSLNPTQAPFAIHGVFHKGYEKLHAQAALLTQEPSIIAFKGEGGESEINPRVSTTICGVQNVAGKLTYIEQEWPTYLNEVSGAHTEVSAEYLQQLWLGNIEDSYGDAAVISTVAVLLKQFQPEYSQQECLQLAKQYWSERNK